jgi:CRISPR system Cascade subunit CasE
MLYLSRLILDVRHRQARRDLGDAYQLHRTVLGAFPQAPANIPARDHFGLLYRAEPVDGAPMLVRLLVQSHIAPDWSSLPDGYLGPSPDSRGNPAVRPVGAEYDTITTGARLVFRLRANPTKRLSDRTPGRDDPLVGKRVALLREADQMAWLARKGERHGFRLVATEASPEVPEARAASQETARGRRRRQGGASAITLSFGAVLFSGQLEVTDRAAFGAALADGIGSGKAFGFGLLSIAAIR